MSQKRPNRYPGVQPFQKEQAHLFFGRDEAIERLYDLILLEKLVVLFGKSGYGKSSLLNAGILPLLDRETEKGRRRFFPVVIRFNAFGGGFDTLFFRINFHLMRAAGRTTTWRSAYLPDTVWSDLKSLELGKDTTILLIFDQFEEFFTYPDEQQQDFKRQIAELLYADVPTYVKQYEFLSANPDFQNRHSEQELAYYREKMDVRAVFAIRSDRMSDLDRMKDKLPAILHKRCELRALNHEQAREALVEPALKDGDFISQKFEWSDAALKRILDEFSRDKQGREVGVEAFLLQVLAQNVEAQVIRGEIADRDGNGLPDIFPEDLPADLSNIFSEYYQNKIGELPPEQQVSARKLVENGLIFTNEDGDSRRLSVDMEVLMNQYKVDESLLKELEDKFLIRREVNSVGNFSFEISHDTLVPPIFEAKKNREYEVKRANQEPGYLTYLDVNIESPTFWDKLIESITYDRAILVIGTNAIPYYSLEPDSETNIQYTFGSYTRKKVAEALGMNVASYFERDNLFEFSDMASKHEAQRIIRRALSRGDFVPDSDLLRQIVQLPFSTIISLNPDNVILNAFSKYGVPIQSDYFTTQDKSTQWKKLQRPTIENPLLYNLFGSIEGDLDSILLDYSDIYSFIKTLFEYNRFPYELYDKLHRASCFVLLGFDIEQWNFQLILSSTLAI